MLEVGDMINFWLYSEGGANWICNSLSVVGDILVYKLKEWNFHLLNPEDWRKE